MIYRRFGKTELEMPVLSFGCMRSMHDWTDKPLESLPQTSTDKLAEIVEAAIGHGMNHFETAHGYGSSERQMGAVLPRLKRKEYILQTKAVPTHDPDEFVHKVHESIDRLGVDYVDLLGLHGINDYNSLWNCCRKGGCLHAARKLQAEGKVGHVGFSGHGPLDVILEAINHEEDGGFDYINIHWYYIYDVNRPAIERAAERDMGVYIISPTDKGGMLHTPPPSFTELCEPFSPILFNDVYCLNQPGVTSISIGASRVSDFDEHLKALEYLAPNSALPFISVVEKLEEKMQHATGHRRPEQFWHQLPDREITPGNINLRFIHWLYNLARGWDLKTFAKTRYNMLGTGSAWVQGNSGICLSNVSFKEIREKYPTITEEFLQEIQDAHILLSQ